jgi:hypothetical protein
MAIIGPAEWAEGRAWPPDRDALATEIGADAKLDTQSPGDIREIAVEWQVFGKDSPDKDATRRRADESELVRSRKPKRNIAP